LGRGITIEPDCCIGGGATILPGRTIGKGSTVGAGAVVTKVCLQLSGGVYSWSRCLTIWQDVPPFTHVVGNPARFLRDISSE
jgi:acetyltransferase-like isoleucine patch superfamily enzyme